MMPGRVVTVLSAGREEQANRSNARNARDDVTRDRRTYARYAAMHTASAIS